MNKQIAPYGSWRSPITTDLIVSATVGLGSVRTDGEDIYWLESRPLEGGRSVIVRYTQDGSLCDVTPAPFNVRTRVHEYGGGAYTVRDGVVYFSNFADQQLYRITPGQAPVALTAPGPRYADGVVDTARGRFICVREEHTDTAVLNTIVSIDLAGGGESVLACGHDFYSSPRLSPDGSQLAWLSWNHPDMPWDGTTLWLAELTTDGPIGEAVAIAGGRQESVFQPEWSPDGVLYFVSDRTGWWNLYRWRGEAAETLHERAAEFGLPQWVFGLSTYAFLNADCLLCTFGEQGLTRLGLLDTQTLEMKLIDTPYSEVSGPQFLPGRAIFTASSTTEANAVVCLDLATYRIEVLRRASDLSIDRGYFSIPEPVTFPTTDGRTAYGFFYAPQNRDFEAPSGERPPLLVKSHGGPTAATTSAFNLKIQYWTSRGFGVLDVNYGGSTGYGRAFREQLNDRWGIVDVDDCVSGANYLVERGDADVERLAIDGGSAGGFTTLCALTFRHVFKAGASYYGVSDLEALAQDTHKFESRYLDKLVGPYPERLDIYRERSPIHFTDRLDCPIIFFQGLEDKVVPPSQAEVMVEALRTRGLPVAYVPFAGEQHGFRRAENIKRSLDAEFYFYSQVFRFESAEQLEPLHIFNQ